VNTHIAIAILSPGDNLVNLKDLFPALEAASNPDVERSRGRQGDGVAKLVPPAGEVLNGKVDVHQGCVSINKNDASYGANAATYRCLKTIALHFLMNYSHSSFT
jgi:hypothetical protein